MPTPFDLWVSRYVTYGPVEPLLLVAALLGWCASRLCWHWLDCLTWERPIFSVRICPQCGTPWPRRSVGQRFRTLFFANACQNCGTVSSPRVISSIFVALLFAAFTWAVGKFQCQSLTEGGSIDWVHWRILYHLCLITLLITATAIDFRAYLIPDSITLTGIVIGVLGATWFGNLQLIPVWINANLEVPRVAGPYIPQWIKDHWHLHGLAWSLAGLVAGAGLTWLVRAISSQILGKEALGSGDITLMAMIGSFVGWQPILFIFALAPLCGISLAIGARIVTGKSYVPYGPYLSAATLVVLFSWRWLWPPLRYVLGHPPTIGLLVGGALLALAVLLGAIRIFRAIPVN